MRIFRKDAEKRQTRHIYALVKSFFAGRVRKSLHAIAKNKIEWDLEYHDTILSRSEGGYREYLSSRPSKPMNFPDFFNSAGYLSRYIRARKNLIDDLVILKIIDYCQRRGISVRGIHDVPNHGLLW